MLKKTSHKKYLSLLVIAFLIIISFSYYSLFLNKKESKNIDNKNITKNNSETNNNKNINKNNNFNKSIEKEKYIDLKEILGTSNNSTEKIIKNISIDDQTSLFYRNWDKIEIKAEIFNNTEKEKNLKIKFESSDVLVNKSEKNITISAKNSNIVNFWVSSKISKNKNIEYKILALWENIENSDIIKNIIENKDYKNINIIYKKWWLAKLEEKQNFKINIPENINLKKSKVKISFSNNLLENFEINSFDFLDYDSIEQISYKTYINTLILNNPKIFKKTISEKKLNENINLWLNKIYNLQDENWWFSNWKNNNNSNLDITAYILRNLINIKNNNISIKKWVIEKSEKYLEKNISNINKAELFYTFSKIWKWELINKKIFQNNSKDDFNKDNFNRSELIFYTYWLINSNKIKYKSEIEENIVNIISELKNDNSIYLYSTNKSDKALFISMLIDYWYKKEIILNYIKELYSLDWMNNYSSAIEKNNIIATFTKYTKKYYNKSLEKFAFSIWTIQNREKRFYLWWQNPNIISREFILDDILQYKENYIELMTYILSGKEIFTNLTLETVPSDKFKIKNYSNWIKINREIFEILDETNLNKCLEKYSINNKNINCSKFLKKITDNQYIKWKKYKVLVNIFLESKNKKENMVLEDHIPSTFKVLKIKNSSLNNWNYIKYLKNKIFARTNKNSDNNLFFEYIVTPEFKWEFSYPPVNAYMMYNWDIRANSEFQKIIVK